MVIITTEGGIVQAVCTDNEELLRELDTEGIDSGPEQQALLFG